MRKILLLIPLLASAALSQDICGSKVYAADEPAAKEKALADLSKSIASRISTESVGTELIKNGKTTLRDSAYTSIQSAMRVTKSVKYELGKEQGSSFAKACINARDAAKPYLDSLRYLAGMLAEKSCDNLNETLKSIADLENIIIPLGQMSDSLQKEYQKTYAECGKMGIYLEVKESILGSKSSVVKEKLEELLSQGNCKAEPKARSGGFTLKVEAKDCNHKPGEPLFHYCGSCAKVELADGRNKKGGYINNSIETKVGWSSKEAACEKAAAKAAEEIWSKVSGKLTEACN